MNVKYIDLINQTYYFPQEEFTLEKDRLLFHNIDLMKLVEQYGTPLKFTYLPQISNNISRAKTGVKTNAKAIESVLKNVVFIVVKLNTFYNICLCSRNC